MTNEPEGDLWRAEWRGAADGSHLRFCGGRAAAGSVRPTRGELAFHILRQKGSLSTVENFHAVIIHLKRIFNTSEAGCLSLGLRADILMCEVPVLPWGLAQCNEEVGVTPAEERHLGTQSVLEPHRAER